MADNNESFVIDDDFDPLADIDLDEYDQDGDADYLAPIPDADKSVVPPRVDLPPEQRIEKLFAGMPGQLHRLLSAVDACREPRTLEEAAAAVEASFPQGASVFEPTQIVLLMERAGALEKIEPESAEESADGKGSDAQPEPAQVAAQAEGQTSEQGEQPANGEGDYITVTPAAPATFVATEAGLAAYEKHSGSKVVLDLVQEKPEYLPIYQRILTMCNIDGGSAVAPLNKAVDSDPLLQEPRLFCTYFLNRLEGVGALVWRDAWKITQAGRDALASDVFAN